MGAGKTTVGKRLAKLKGLRFIDSDQEIERRTGVDVAFIFEKEGEPGFRRREREVIAELTQEQGVVLATGGGAVNDGDNRRDLAARGFVVYLRTSVDQQLDRTRYSKHRPLLQTGDPRQRLEELMAQREPLYREIADLVVNTDGLQSANLVKIIDDHLSTLAPE
jgi:shikimate kinase